MSVSSARRPWPMLAIAAVFVVACVIAVFINRHVHSIPMPTNLPELAAHIHELHPELQVISVQSKGDLRWGFFLCTLPREGETALVALRGLPRRTEQIDRWQGVVLVEKHSGAVEVDIPGPPHGIRAGSFKLFGDVELLRRLGDCFQP